MLLLLKRNSKLIEGALKFRVDIIDTVQNGPLLWSSVINNFLIIDWWNFQVGPRRHFHCKPVPVGFQPKVKKPRWLIFLGRDCSHNIFIEALWNKLHFNVGVKTVFIVSGRYFTDN